MLRQLRARSRPASPTKLGRWTRGGEREDWQPTILQLEGGGDVFHVPGFDITAALAPATGHTRHRHLTTQLLKRTYVAFATQVVSFTMILESAKNG